MSVRFTHLASSKISAERLEKNLCSRHQIEMYGHSGKAIHIKYDELRARNLDFSLQQSMQIISCTSSSLVQGKAFFSEAVQVKSLWLAFKNKQKKTKKVFNQTLLDLAPSILQIIVWPLLVLYFPGFLETISCSLLSSFSLAGLCLCYSLKNSGFLFLSFLESICQ